MVPVERIELPTFGLQNRCSTAELNRLKAIDRIGVGHVAADRIWMPHGGSVYGRRLGRVNRRIPGKTAFGPWCCHTTRRSCGWCGYWGGFGKPLRGGLAMGSAYPPPRMPDCHRDQAAARGDDDPGLQSLRQENARLRELVVQLSSLVIKTIADQK
jgi:hypothetical protein